MMLVEFKGVDPIGSFISPCLVIAPRFQMPIPIAEACHNCKFRVHKTCHRIPPVTSSYSNGIDRADWPKIELTDWCGEWKMELREDG
jgi:hypothetical protein